MILRALSLLLLVASAACAKGVTVLSPVVVPARVPVQVFPSVWVAGGANDEELYLLDRIAAQLAQDTRREVRRVDTQQLEPARLAHQIPGITAVLRLTLEVRSDLQKQADTVPVQYCGMWGCSVHYQTYVEQRNVVSAQAVLYVHDGPTAQVLESARFKAQASDAEADDPRALALERLADQLVVGTNFARVREPYRFVRSGVKQADRALDLLERGQFERGRQELERAAKALGGLDKKTQARVWYNLGMARLLAPGAAGLTVEAGKAAERALAWAQRLEPTPLYSQAQQRVAEAQKRQRVLEQQARARQYNYALVAAPSKGG